MINNRNIIHEGVIKDIVDLLTNNDLIKRNKLLNTKQTYFSSITKAASNLVLTFPVLVDDSVPLSTARLISKAVEHKMVTMLQMLFSAIDIANNKDAFAFVGKVHKNLTSDDLISFINRMDSIPLKSRNESTAELDIEAINKAMIECMQDDNVYLKTGFNESLNDTFWVESGMHILQEGKGSKKKGKKGNKSKHDFSNKTTTNTIPKDNSDTDMSETDWFRQHVEDRGSSKPKEDHDDENSDIDFEYEYDNDRIDSLGSTEKLKKEKNKKYRKFEDISKKEKPKKPEDPRINKRLKDLEDKWKEIAKKEAKKEKKKPLYNHKDLEKMTISSDVKKANEEVPSLMIINFRTKDNNNTIRSAVIGVKAKIIYIPQDDIIDRIITKNNDNNGLFNFLRATTGEISMLKDFVFAINKAKLDAINSRPDSSPIWKMLERRYIMNKKNWLMSSYNGSGTAIAVLVVSKDTVDRLESDYGFKCNPSKLLEIMEAYSIMGFIITDDIKEQVLSLYDDNSTRFEILSYSAYEKEDQLQYKKIINLITGGKE